MRFSYVDAAIGWVQLKREGNVCTVRAKICPEHKIKNQLYDLESRIDEVEEEILDVECSGCAASEGKLLTSAHNLCHLPKMFHNFNFYWTYLSITQQACNEFTYPPTGACKHTTAFLSWLHEMSMTPAPTDVPCYWKKPRLARVNDKSIATLKDFKKISSVPVPQSENALDLFVTQLPPFSTVLCAQGRVESEFISLSLHHCALRFSQATDENNRTFSNFLLYLCNTVSREVCEEACKKTVEQRKSKLWFSLRYGRISGSTLYELSRAKDNDSVIDKVMGASKVPLTKAIKRGKDLEEDVFKEVCKQMEVQFRHSGMLVSHEMPHFGVSPDGVSEDHILEIKCPEKEKNMKYYIQNGSIVAKVRAQMQLEMFIFKKKRGVLAIADPKFENNKKISFYHDAR